MALLCIMLLAAFAAYLPVTQGNYVYHDDYYLFLVKGRVQNHPQYIGYMKHYGRPVAIYIKCFLSTFFETVEEANVVRAFTVVAIAVLGFLLIKNLQPYVKTWHAIFLAILVFTLPPFQPTAAMIANSTHVYAAIAVTAAALIMSTMLRRKAGIIALCFGILLATGMFVAALLTYQPAAFFYLTAICLFVIYHKFDDIKSFVRSFIVILAPVIIATFIYSIYVKSLSPERTGLVSDIGEKLAWLWHPVLPTVLSFWFLRTVNTGMYIFGILLVVLLLRKLLPRFVCKELSSQEPASRSQWPVSVARILGIIFIGCLSFLPNLVAEQSILFRRILIALQPFALLVSFAIIKEILTCRTNQCKMSQSCKIFVSKTITVLLFVVAMFSIYSANHNVMNYYVVPQTVEVAYLRKQLATLQTDRTHRIHIVRPRLPYLSAYSTNDEFGVPTTIFPQDGAWIVMAICQELGIPFDRDKQTNGPNQQQYDYPGDWPPKTLRPVPQDAFIIDMNRINLQFYD